MTKFLWIVLILALLFLVLSGGLVLLAIDHGWSNADRIFKANEEVSFENSYYVFFRNSSGDTVDQGLISGGYGSLWNHEVELPPGTKGSVSIWTENASTTSCYKASCGCREICNTIYSTRLRIQGTLITKVLGPGKVILYFPAFTKATEDGIKISRATTNHKTNSMKIADGKLTAVKYYVAANSLEASMATIWPAGIVGVIASIIALAVVWSEYSKGYRWMTYHYTYRHYPNPYLNYPYLPIRTNQEPSWFGKAMRKIGKFLQKVAEACWYIRLP